MKGNDVYRHGKSQFSKDTSSYTEETLRLHHEFFDRIIAEFNLQKTDGDIIAVLHILPDAVPFTAGLKRIGNINMIIPKPKSINQESLETLSELPVKHLTRDDIRTVISYVKRETVFMDIGGYFSPIIDELRQTCGNHFLGIVEDTENGLQKYEKRGIDFPFLSVARSPLKENEDTMVGQAIAYSAEAVLRQHNVVINGLQVGVIGYGKIGRSVARNIKHKHGKVSIYDSDNIKLTHALSSGFNVMHKPTILKTSDIICLATGNRSLSGDEFSAIKNGSWVFSVTSSDDELGKEWLNDNYDGVRISQYVTKYSRGDHYFYLLNDGNAINFIHGTTVGDFILLVHAELLIATYKLLKREIQIGEHEVDRRTRSRICGVWLTHFKMGKK